MNYSHQCISMVAAKTKNGGAMWRCSTADGVTFFVFPDGRRPGNLTLFGEYIPLMLALKEGEQLRWTRCPIALSLFKNGDYWDIGSVAPRPDGSEPDTLWVPDPQLARLGAVVWERTLLKSQAVIWDSETTDADPDYAEIVSLGAVDRYGHELITLTICPQHPKRLDESGAGVVNGFTAERVKTFPGFSQQYLYIRSVLDSHPWVIYNAAYDTRVLERDCLRAGYQPIVSTGVTCAMEAYARYAGEWDAPRQQFVNHKLTEAAQQFGIEVEGAHDALFDCQLTLAVIKAIAG